MASDGSGSSDDYTRANAAGDDKPAFRTASREARDAEAAETTTKEESADGAADDAAPAPEYLHGFKLFSVMCGMVIVMLLAMIDITILSTAIPQITSDFHRLEDVGWYVGAYQLASATIQPLTGKLYTFFSTKWTYLLCFAVFELGSLICGVAQSSTMLIIGRAVAGMGSSGLINGTLTILAGAIVPEKRPLYNGLAFGLSQIGIIAGPLLGGVFTEYSTWRWCFFLNLPLGAVAAVLVLFAPIRDQMPKPPVTKTYLRSLVPRIDMTGFVLFAPASIMFLLALQFGPERGWSSSEVIGLFCGAGVTILVFLAWERRVGKEAMIPLALATQRVMWSSSLYMACLMSSNILAGAFFPIYFQSVRGLSPVMSGVYFMPAIGTQIVAVVLSGAFMVKLRYYIPWAVVSGIFIAIGGGLISTWDAHSNLGHVFGYQIILAIRGLGMQVGIIALQNHFGGADIAIANAILIFCQNFFAAVAVTIGNTIFQEGLVSEIDAHVPGVNSDAAIAAGGSADAVRAIAPPGSEQLKGLLEAYSIGVSHVSYLLLAMGVAATVSSFGMGWVDLRTTKTKKAVVAEATESKSEGEAEKKEEEPEKAKEKEEV